MSRPAGVEIATIPDRLVSQAVGVLARAFAEDPILTFYLNDPRRRKPAYRAFFGVIIRENLPFGHVYAARSSGRIVGVAVWHPPNATGPSVAGRARWAMTRLVMRTLFPRRAGGIFRGFAATESLHPKDPHWYLAFVGVDVGVQGAGIGSRLLEPVLRRADETETACYLETPFPRTHAFYRRLGFEITSESHPFEGAPPLWTMLRPPRSDERRAPLGE